MLGRTAVPVSVDAQRSEDRQIWALACVAFGALVLMTLAFSELITPNESLIALTLMAMAIVWVVVRPSVGVYLMVAFTLLGDTSTTPWYPFAKNLSSFESILFVSDRIIINPLEVFMIVTTASWLLRWFGDPDWTFRRGRLLTPALVFTGFVAFGVVYGLGRGGNVNVGLWEVRPLVYLPLFYVLVTNLLTSTAQYQRLMWLAMVAVTSQSMLALYSYFQLPSIVRDDIESLTEHAASVHYAALIVLVASVWLVPRCSSAARVAVLFMAIPVIWAFLVSERRSAMVGLALGLLLFSVMLFKLNRRAFAWFVPIVGLFSVGYLLAFWNGHGSLAFPAQAIKSAIAPGQLTGADKSSADYREIEALNIWYTIRADPVRGIGFGHAFYRPYPLPDISFFPFWEFMPHHSLLYIWLKTGFAGFVAMLFLIVRTIQHGVRTVLRLPSGDLQAIALTAVLYVVMYVVFSYVDIAWDIRSMIFLSVAMAICADMASAVRLDVGRTDTDFDLERHQLGGVHA